MTYLPLSGHVTESGGDTQDERIECCQDIWSNDGIVGFRWSVHLGKDLFRKGFLYSGYDKKDGILKKNNNVLVYLCFPACTFNASLLCLCNFISKEKSENADYDEEIS